MNVVKEINSINKRELSQGADYSGSWHDEYKDSAYIFVGGLPFDLTEDKDSGKSKGFAFIQYEDQRSTILSVDNLNGAKVLGRTLRVDHVKNYRQPKHAISEETEEPIFNAIPKQIKADKKKDPEYKLKKMKKYGIDPEDPMAEYLLKKAKSNSRSHKKKD
ncbi:hypothetical protein BB560_005046 [Smittium megazygosporum]|uniref:RRM domain-containing protein n=1 Tax=Smittium megazygosporum TaxID=133381 RepID=A0A2T9Z7L1_9FUNG|nr:hypothetical protein BB560_005046 [Smittium megazygosporum]